jgi:hypothetical protein
MCFVDHLEGGDPAVFVVYFQCGAAEDVQRKTSSTNKSDVFEMEKPSHCLDKKNLLKLVHSGPIFKADRLTNIERLKLRKKALKLDVGSRFSVGM